MFCSTKRKRGVAWVQGPGLFLISKHREKGAFGRESERLKSRLPLSGGEGAVELHIQALIIEERDTAGGGAGLNP